MLRWFPSLVVLLAAIPALQADVTLSSLFADHPILQRRRLVFRDTLDA